MRWMAILIGVCVLSIGLSGCDDLFDEGFEFEDEFNFAEPAAGLTTLDLTGVNGAVVVRGVRTDVVDVVAALYVRSSDEQEGQAYADDMAADVRRDLDTLVVRTVLPIGRQPSEIEEARIDYDVLLPRGLDLRIETSNGSVTVVDIDGEVRIRTTNGSVVIDDVLGGVDARDEQRERLGHVRGRV